MILWDFLPFSAVYVHYNPICFAYIDLNPDETNSRIHDVSETAVVVIITTNNSIHNCKMIESEAV